MQIFSSKSALRDTWTKTMSYLLRFYMGVCFLALFFFLLQFLKTHLISSEKKREPHSGSLFSAALGLLFNSSFNLFSSDISFFVYRMFTWFSFIDSNSQILHPLSCFVSLFMVFYILTIVCKCLFANSTIWVVSPLLFFGESWSFSLISTFLGIS